MAHLKAVPPPEASEPEAPNASPPMTVSQAAASGDRLAELLAMRAVIARAIDSEKTLARDLAALTKRLVDIGREIEELRSQTEGDEIGEAAHSPDERFDPSAI